jgi:hypothetical protein
VFDRVTHALVCSTAGPPQCPDTPVSWTNGSVSFPAGRSVTESLFYDQRSGIVTATVLDVTTGVASSATYHAGIGQSFKLARIGAEVGGTPWDDAGYIAPPPVATKLAAFSGAELTTYSGSNSTLRSWWMHSADHDQDGTSAGDTRATRPTVRWRRRSPTCGPGGKSRTRLGRIRVRAAPARLSRVGRSPASARGQSQHAPGGPPLVRAIGHPDRHQAGFAVGGHPALGLA